MTLSTVEEQKLWATLVAKAQKHDGDKKTKMATFHEVWTTVNESKEKPHKHAYVKECLNKLAELGYVKTRKYKGSTTYGVTAKAKSKWKEVKKECP